MSRLYRQFFVFPTLFYSKNILTPLIYSPSFLNIKIIKCLIILLCLFASNGANSTNTINNNSKQILKFDNDFLNNNYLNELVKKSDRFKLTVNDLSKSPDSKSPLKQVQILLCSENGRYAKYIELTGLHEIFDANVSAAKPLLNQPFPSINESTTLNDFSSKQAKVGTLIELFFPNSEYGKRIKIEQQIENNQINMKKFGLIYLNMSDNGINEEFLNGYSSFIYTSLFDLILREYFSHLKVIQFSFNKFHKLERKNLELFIGSVNHPSKLETILFNSNEITSIRHDTFYDFKYLKYIDLSNNKLKLIHPLTFSMPSSIYLTLLNLSSNNLKTMFNTPQYIDQNNNDTNYSNNYSLPKLKYLYLKNNDEISCDCGLLWLFRLKEELEITLDEFKCNKQDFSLDDQIKNQSIIFDLIKNETILTDACIMPNLIVNTQNFKESSAFSLFRELSKRWFAWNVFLDVIPLTTPYPYLMSQNEKNIDDIIKNDASVEKDLNNTLNNQEKHVFHVWRGSDAIFECNNKDKNDKMDNSRSTIIWKTQYGYLSYLDKDLMQSLTGDDSYYENENFQDHLLKTEKNYNSSNTNYNNSQNLLEKGNDNHYSFKIFYKMNRLTKIYKNLTVSVSHSFGAKTKSNFYVNYKNQLIVTKMRQVVAGPFVCISINERGINMYEYDMHVRTGVGEFFIYSLFVSLISMIVPSILGIIVCCICEYQADKNYPMTPPCYPTPQAQTPPNFDFNEWMANAASYLPNINIHDTLEQVSKKLRKGMEKASVTVKSLGLTSTAYIYSMYEQSTQRWSDIKNYVPSLNVPTLTLPTMKYPPVGQLANRMKMGMGNMFIQLREFCGTSDLMHTASIVDIDIDTNASNAVGNAVGYYTNSSHHQQVNNQNIHQNYYRFLHLIREESNKYSLYSAAKQNKIYNNNEDGAAAQTNSPQAQTPTSTITTLSMEMTENVPTTSAFASVSESLASELAKPNNISFQMKPINLYVKMLKSADIKDKYNGINQSDNDNDDEVDDDENDNEDEEETNKSINLSKRSSIGNIRQIEQLDNSEESEERVSKLKPSSFNTNKNIKKSNYDV